MNRISIIAVALCVLGMAGMDMGQDDGPVGDYPAAMESGGYVSMCNGDPWNAVPRPSGLRFMPAGGGTGMPCCGDYNYCWTGCSCARCAHWTQYSWYAPWCYQCHECYKADGKHEWLH